MMGSPPRRRAIPFPTFLGYQTVPSDRHIDPSPARDEPGQWIDWHRLQPFTRTNGSPHQPARRHIVQIGSRRGCANGSQTACRGMPHTHRFDIPRQAHNCYVKQRDARSLGAERPQCPITEKPLRPTVPKTGNPAVSNVRTIVLLSLPLLVGCQPTQRSSPQSNEASQLDSSTKISDLDTPAGESLAKRDDGQLATPPQAAPHGQESSSADITVQEALAALIEGNQRFVDGKSIHPHESSDYRASLAHEQHPFATILTCSDSRVTPVLIFDQGIGDLFVIRVAGNVVDEDVAGSIEYAVNHLGTTLLVVLGHENCGAVTAAYHSFVAKDLVEREPHEIESLLLHIEPALRKIDRSKSIDRQLAEGVEANVHEAIQSLARLPDLRTAQEQGLVKIVGAIYSVRTGKVSWLNR